MNQALEPVSDRRAMLCRCLRYMVGTGIVAASLGLVGRSLRISGDRACDGNLPCSECNRLAGCRLPQAIQMRNARRGNHHAIRREERS